MEDRRPVGRAALEVERLRSARWINAFRFVGLLVALLIELYFSHTVPGWIGAPIGLFVGWTAAAAALFVAGARSAAVARVGSLAIAFIDMPLLFVLLTRVLDALRAAGLVADAARLSAHGGLYFVGLLMLASLALDRRRLALGTLVAAACALGLQWRSGSWDTSIAVMTVGAIGLLGAMLAYASGRTGVLVERVADEQRRRERLQRYFSPQVAARLADAPALIGGRQEEVTILFCDLRDFTPLAEALPAPATVALLNGFLGCMVEAVFTHDGTLDKYLGDGLMAYFGAPVAQPDHAARAVRCALAMRAALAELNRDRGAGGDAPLRMGIGIHTGPVVLGDIGAPSRREYTIIGDTVNVAARLQELTKVEGVDVLVSESTRARLDDGIPFSTPRPLSIRGRTAPLLASAPG